MGFHPVRPRNRPAISLKILSNLVPTKGEESEPVVVIHHLDLSRNSFLDTSSGDDLPPAGPEDSTEEWQQDPTTVQGLLLTAVQSEQ